MAETAISTYLAEDSVQQSIRNVLGNNAQQFTASIASLVMSNQVLQKCDRKSLIMACLTAASLDLPINQNLGFAYILPYKVKVKKVDDKGHEITTWEDQAQFQMGYKGFVQLAMRSGQFRTINVTEVREGELESIDRLTGEYKFSWLVNNREASAVIGYVAYMKLLNGFEKTMYMSIDDLSKHGLKYSKTMQKGFGLWKDEFDAMATKTMIKLMLSKYAPLNTQMQKAQLADQSIIRDDEDYEYIDNKPQTPKEIADEKNRQKLIDYIENVKTPEELEKCYKSIPEEDIDLQDLYINKMESLETSTEK